MCLIVKETLERIISGSEIIMAGLNFSQHKNMNEKKQQR